MPSNATLRRQRFLGGTLGAIVLGFALTYHFFPGLFHVQPDQAPKRAMSLGGVMPASGLQPERASAIDELNAGPPLTLAPTAVIVSRNSSNAQLGCLGVRAASLDAEHCQSQVLFTRQRGFADFLHAALREEPSCSPSVARTLLHRSMSRLTMAKPPSPMSSHLRTSCRCACKPR